MKILYCFTVLYALTISFLHAQSNYKQGYVVNMNNDTLKGFIDYKEWSHNPTGINFKTGNSNTPQKYTPLNTKAFSVNNLEYYERFIVQVSKSHVELSDISHNLDTTYRIDTVFLKSMVLGKHISLYSFTDEIKTRFYVLDNSNGQINELKYLLYLNDETNTIKESSGYRLQLLRLAANYQPGNTKLINLINESSYSEKKLTAIFVAINGDSNQLIVRENAFGKRFFVGAGVRNSKLAFSGVNTAFPDGTQKSSISPVLSTGIDFLTNKNTKTFFLRFELELAANHFKFPKIVSSNNNMDNYNSLDFKQYTLALMPQVVYNFYSTDNLKLFIDLGFSANFSAYNNYDYVTTYSDNSTSIRNKFPEFEQFYFSLPLKAGVLLNKHFEIYGSYWLSSSTTNYSQFSAGLSAYQAGINYMFGK
ncbi:hypothetical protein SNE25_01310 [Mucilaginibacter sabulilitoris]|uniref:Outer membrane protein beta-barrel domain-containing protein n=1 Tax=Mucilaginibacter sabulilitoris TaxID=1173583 RepID=A0ABZ0TN30_9SPHI|nr:hypothetical protein [Mucilaginibacter sabulilitoris]WPU94161.1 hypothetical protein SNE25_01310 [Mucilaginibacter sabulilitoris]